MTIPRKDQLAYEITVKVFDLLESRQKFSEAYLERQILGVIEQHEKKEETTHGTRSEPIPHH